MDIDSLNPRERLETLSAYLDGELPDEAARDVTAWLERHPEALREIEHQRRLWSLLGRYADEPVPEGFARRVLGAVGAQPGVPSAANPSLASARNRPRRRMGSFAAAAAVLAAVGAGVLLATHPQEGPPGGPAPEAIAALDADFMQHADLAQLATLSDDQFAVLLVDEPDALADGGVQGG